MLDGTTSAYISDNLRFSESESESDSSCMSVDDNDNDDNDDDNDNGDSRDDRDEIEDLSPAPGPRALSSVKLASRIRESRSLYPSSLNNLVMVQEWQYPKSLEALATSIREPGFPYAFKRFLHTQQHLNSEKIPDEHVSFNGKLRVFHSAIAQYYAPSDLCGVGGMHREHIRSNPAWHNRMNRRDTVFVSLDESQPGMQGMLVARVLLFFSYFDSYLDTDIPCALVNWFTRHGDKPDEATGMWMVQPEYHGGTRTLQVIHLDSIARGAHLLPVYGTGFLPEDFDYVFSLDAFKCYFVNHYIDHHAHEFLTF